MATTVEVVQERELVVLSSADKDGNLLWGTCTFVVGEGMKVELVNGRGKVPASLAGLVAKIAGIEVPALDPEQLAAARSAVPAPVALPADPDAALLEAARQARAARGVTTSEEELDAARRYLASEGLPVPVTTDGSALVALTSDGLARCQARKGDGSQCSNPTTDGAACNIGKHREQLEAPVT